ncbi:hypothetical protein E2320_021566, partial [Naja naja]
MRHTDYYNIFRDQDLSCWVVEIPYKGDVTALFILPDEGKLEHVEAALAIHKTMLNVHESGTEAAATTVVQFMLRSARIKPSLFIIFDRPFLMI